MKYRIVYKGDHYIVQYRGWSTLLIWLTLSDASYMETSPSLFVRIEDAHAAIAQDKSDRAKARVSEVVYTEPK